MRMTVVHLVAPVLLVLTGACSLLDGSDETPSDPNNGRVVFRRSIDSVEPGFDAAAVVLCLGEPGDRARGDYAGSHYYYNAEGARWDKPSTIEVFFAEDFSNRVIEITVRPPYQGRTLEGVGMGTPREVVRLLYGTPDTSGLKTSWMRLGAGYFSGDGYYRGDSVAMVFGYDSGLRVNKISLVRRHF